MSHLSTAGPSGDSVLWLRMEGQFPPLSVHSRFLCGGKWGRGAGEAVEFYPSDELVTELVEVE